MINRKQLLAFLQFIKANKKLKINSILALSFLAFIPAKNYYYQLNFPASALPIIRSANQQLLPPSDYPVNTTKIPAPNLTARSILVIDVHSKAILYQKNPDLKLLPASITKVVTALVSLDHYPLDKVLTINNLNDIGQIMELELEEKITVENLLYGLLVQSANDAAYALADNYPNGQTAFIEQMNQLVKDLGLHDTQFTNPSGLDDFGHYTTVHDLANISAYAASNPVFSKMVATKNITVTDVDNTIIHELESINQLLGEVPGLVGLKTGWTELAGECLVTLTKRNNHQIITVVLDSQDRFSESQQLINWAFNNHKWQKVLPAIHQ